MGEALIPGNIFGSSGGPTLLSLQRNVQDEMIPLDRSYQFYVISVIFDVYSDYPTGSTVLSIDNPQLDRSNKSVCSVGSLFIGSYKVSIFYFPSDFLNINASTSLAELSIIAFNC